MRVRILAMAIVSASTLSFVTITEVPATAAPAESVSTSTAIVKLAALGAPIRVGAQQQQLVAAPTGETVQIHGTGQSVDPWMGSPIQLETTPTDGSVTITQFEVAGPPDSELPYVEPSKVAVAWINLSNGRSGVTDLNQRVVTEVHTVQECGTKNGHPFCNSRKVTKLNRERTISTGRGPVVVVAWGSTAYFGGYGQFFAYAMPVPHLVTV
ncbi:hypothetical protein [Gordonia sp. CPCC 205333]|uniref:hypothetical protein n=1 Tax=Gordonia sp. CPCC 205333 TaxID=3140790 RepID=UPI003AF3492D